MKLDLNWDECYPYLFVTTVEEATEQHERTRAWIKKSRQKRDIGPIDPKQLERFCDVPDDLGAELVALRKREQELIEEITRHVVATGQRPAGWED